LELSNRSLELALSLDWGSKQGSERGEDESFSSLECSCEQRRRVGMKTDRIRTDIIDIIFVFVFLVEFGFEYG